MKFIFKNGNSLIYTEGLTYKKNSAANNALLKAKLLLEQKNFCAYTERFIDPTSSAEVEHFNPSKKYVDDYYNYYAVLRYANMHKLKFDVQYKNAAFSQTLFFQNKEEFKKRILFEDGRYRAVNDDDTAASGLIEYLGFNAFALTKHRGDHIKRLVNTLESFTPEERLEYFSIYHSELSFASAIEDEFKIDLSEIIHNLP